KRDSESPAGHVHFVDALVAYVAVAGIPDPVPVVVKAVSGERLHGRGTRPQVVVDARRDRLLRRVSDRVAPFVAQAAGQVEVAEQAIPHFLDAFAHASARAALRAVLDNAVIFVRGAHEL